LAKRAAVIKPVAEELRWRQIPWVMDLTVGQRLAQAEGRPIFLWVTGDDPLERCGGYAAGLRAGPLSDQNVIQCVTTNFVPVAVNLYKVRQARNAGGELFRSVQRQKDQYQGIWIVSPAGKVLAAHHEFKSPKTWPQEVLDTANAALMAFGWVPPRRVKATDPLPFRGYGTQPNGSICLGVYARQMLGGGRQHAPKSVHASRYWLWDGALRPDGPAVIDSLTLTAKEWATLAPPRTDVGSTWAVPEAVARQFCRVLIPSSDQSAMPRPADASLARLKASIEAVEDDQVCIRLTGSWQAVHLQEGDAKRPLRGEAIAEGLAHYDFKRQAMHSVLLVFSGSYGRSNESVSAAGAVVEWQSKRPAR
jgi:hypothetical protein